MKRSDLRKVSTPHGVCYFHKWFTSEGVVKAIVEKENGEVVEIDRLCIIFLPDPIEDTKIDISSFFKAIEQIVSLGPEIYE